MRRPPKSPMRWRRFVPPEPNRLETRNFVGRLSRAVPPCGRLWRALLHKTRISRSRRRWESVMRVGIISDTHDQLARTVAAVDLLTAAGATMLLPCGDVTGPQIIHACGRLPTTFVFGNNDDDWP